MSWASLSSEELLAVQRAAFLLGPAIAAVALLVICKPKPREAAAAMVAFLWQLPALLLLQVLASRFDWWHFNAPSNQMLGLPIDLWIGWAIWWGPIAVFLNRWVPIWGIVVASMLLDLLTMPLLEPLVTLGPGWLVGDAAAMALCLFPGLWAARLTREDRNPKRRAMFHVLGWGGYMMLVIPACVLSYTGRHLSDLYAAPDNILEWFLIGAGLFLLFVGVAATAEFARIGEGTPIPFDPPKRVVATGPYAIMANPMQIISAAFMLILALYARSWGLALIAATFFVFDSVYATWYNRAHIAHAMPAAWSAYRGAVDEWRMRWRPFVPGAAEIVITRSGPSHAVWQRVWPWLSKRLEGEIELRTEDRSRLRRLIYRRPADGIEDYGVSAAGRVLEHGPAPLAFVGWLIRFPYLGGALQRLAGLVIFLWRRYTPP